MARDRRNASREQLRRASIAEGARSAIRNSTTLWCSRAARSWGGRHHRFLIGRQTESALSAATESAQATLGDHSRRPRIGAGRRASATRSQPLHAAVGDARATPPPRPLAASTPRPRGRTDVEVDTTEVLPAGPGVGAGEASVPESPPGRASTSTALPSVTTTGSEICPPSIASGPRVARRAHAPGGIAEERTGRLKRRRQSRRCPT